MCAFTLSIIRLMHHSFACLNAQALQQVAERASSGGEAGAALTQSARDLGNDDHTRQARPTGKQRAMRFPPSGARQRSVMIAQEQSPKWHTPA